MREDPGVPTRDRGAPPHPHSPQAECWGLPDVVTILQTASRAAALLRLWAPRGNLSSLRYPRTKGAHDGTRRRDCLNPLIALAPGRNCIGSLAGSRSD
jgi:hypothetical protein